MTTLHHGSATIFQFPVRGRFAATPERNDASSAQQRAAKVAVGGAWYHDEAIRNETDKQAS
jgi:hypothetical protein